jgi:RNA polymerase sigma-70 factor (ECF subfamily)
MDESSVRPDSELIAKSSRGDSSAFGVLVLRYRKMVVGVAYRTCGDGVLAEDIAQETFIRAWTKLSTYRPEGSFRGWLCRIAANLTIDALRRQKPTVELESRTFEASGDGPEAAVLREERAAAVRKAIMKLATHSRMALVLREYEGLSYREIADALGIPLGTVKSRLNDARLRLKAELAAYLEA